MPEVVTCPSCQRKLLLPAEHCGKMVQCPSCHSQFQAQADIPVLSLAVDESWLDPPAARPPATKPRSAVGSVRRALGAAAALVVVVGFLLLFGEAVPRPVPWSVLDPVLDDVQLPPGLVPDPGPLDEDRLADELKPLFESLGAAFHDRDQGRMVDHFDLERLVDELAVEDFLPKQILRDRRGFIVGLRIGLRKSLAEQAPLLKWEKFAIKNVKKLGPDDAVVIVRHPDDEGTVMKMRWWVSRRSGAWKVYDFEDLDVGLRASAIIGTVGGAGADMFEMARAMTNVRDAITAVAVQNDPDTAEKKLKEIERVPLPGKLESLRQLATAVVRLNRLQTKESLAALDQAAALNADMPCLDLFRGIAYNHQGEWDKAFGHLRTYQALLGDDPVVCGQLGLSLRGLRRFKEAQAAYRTALDHNPKDADHFLGLLQALAPGDNRDDLGPRFARLPSARENFITFAEECRDSRDAESLEPLAIAMRKIDPREAAVDFYQALARTWAGRPGEATPFFRAALAKELDPEKRGRWTADYLQAMAQAGMAVEAYGAVPDSLLAFRVLADELKKGFRADDLRRLVALHARKQADDPILPLYRGEVLVREGRYPLAEKSFAAGLALKPDDTLVEQFRQSRVLARFHTGQGMSAYAEIGPRGETFDQLANLCLEDRNYALLQALLDAHAKVAPDSQAVLRFRYRSKIQQGQLAEGIAAFKDALTRLPEDRREELASDFLFAMAEAGKPLEGYQAAPDAPRAFQIVAEELWDRRQLVELRQLVDAHRRRSPDDVWLTYEIGRLALEDKAWDKAGRAFGEGLNKAPEDRRDSFRWNYVYASYKAGRALQIYADLADPKAVFQQLANLMAADKKWIELENLIAAHRLQVGDDDPDVLFFHARTQVFRNDWLEAGVLLRKAYDKQSMEYRRRYYVDEYVGDMEAAGRGLMAYNGSPDEPGAFQTLARRYLTQKKDQDLEKLIALYREDHEADPWLHFYAGELLLLRREAAKAENEFAAALAKAATRDQYSFRDGLYRARIRAGRTVATYQEAGPSSFEQLANHCIAERHIFQLKALIAAHRKAEPDDVDLVAWDVEAFWQEKYYTMVLRLLDKHQEGVFAAPRWRWKAGDYRVRCLVMLKRFPDAVQAAEALVQKNRGNPVLLVLAHAASGDVPQTIAAMEKVGARSYLLDSCYRDADLGPILRGEPFQAFRDRFPEPERRGDDD